MARRFHFLGLAAVAALALSGCGRSEPTASVAARAPTAGRLTVQTQMIADLKPAPGTLTTRDMAEARARIGGVLVSLTIREGDMVRRGQMIAQVRDDRLNLETGAYAAQVKAAAAEAERARADLARTQDLYEHGVYARARLEQAQAQAKTADAALAAARAQRGASAELAGQGAVAAPAAGRVLSADVPVGSVVMPGQTIARITAGPVVVRVELPEANAAALKLGAPVTLSGEAFAAATQGTISQIYPAVSGGQVIADVTAANLPQDKVGQRVQVRVRIGERKAIIIPRRYISTRFGVDYVRLVAADGTVSEAPVQTAEGPTADTAEILSGVRAGDVLTPAAVAR